MFMMIRKISLVLLLVALAAPVSAESITCTECGMMSDTESKFTSRIVEGSNTFYFCDIGDLLVYLNKHRQQDAQIEVKDYSAGEWMAAQAAGYVSNSKKFNSPMGWDIAAFKNRKDAAAYGNAMDYDAALRAVK
jgi:nitrous oxide reductase accessory protein NosL